MKILHFLCLVLVAKAALGKPSSQAKSSKTKVTALFTRVYSQPNYSGNYLDVYDYVPDLFNTGIDDDIDSVYQSGMWMYYENNNYNEGAGRVYFVHGIEISVNFPFDSSNMVSSIRYAGSGESPNDDTWTVFAGQYFTGSEYYGVTDSASLDYLDLDTSSIIVTGLSPWTLYSGLSWSGDSICVYPDTDHDVGPQGDRLDFGIFPDITSFGIPDNSVRSVRKGCWSDNIAKPVEIKYEEKAKNGAWGYVDM